MAVADTSGLSRARRSLRTTTRFFDDGSVFQNDLVKWKGNGLVSRYISWLLYFNKKKGSSKILRESTGYIQLIPRSYQNVNFLHYSSNYVKTKYDLNNIFLNLRSAFMYSRTQDNVSSDVRVHLKFSSETAPWSESELSLECDVVMLSCILKIRQRIWDGLSHDVSRRLCDFLVRSGLNAAMNMHIAHFSEFHHI